MNVAANGPHPFERYRSIVHDWPAFREALTCPLPTCIWANPLRTAPDRLAAWMSAEGHRLAPLAWYPGGFRFEGDAGPGTLIPYRAGHYHVQEEVSLLPTMLLDARPGERVLDLCAAPGNKTAQIGTAMRNRGAIVANDRVGERLHVLRRTLARLGVLNVATTIRDAAAYPVVGPAFDRVLVDVPCSCEGTSRKHPRVLRQSSVAQSRSLGGRQYWMLMRAVELCRPGGRIVYSTCTYAPEENEIVVDAVLRAREGEVRLMPARIEGLISSPGLTHWEGTPLHPDLRHTIRIWPHQNDSGGFYAAALEKLDGGADEFHTTG